MKTRKKREKTEKKWARYGLKRVKESGSPGSPRGFRSLSGLPRLRRAVVQMAVYDPGATLYVGDPADDGLGSLKASLELLLVTLAAW